VTRVKQATDFVCMACGSTFPSFATVVVPIPGRAEYLCAPCYEASKADTIRKAA
jgi:DNA-directed RNA polymerase subunit RPC12/RpoP